MDFNEWNKAIIKEFRENGGRWVASLRVPRSPRRASARPGDRKSLARSGDRRWRARRRTLNTGPAASGQEELYVGLSGYGWVEVDGERLDLGPEILVAVPAGTSRKVRVGPDGLRLGRGLPTPGAPAQ